MTGNPLIGRCLPMVRARLKEGVGGDGVRSSKTWTADDKTQLFFLPDLQTLLIIDHQFNKDGEPLLVPMNLVAQMKPDLAAFARGD